jgi:DNA-binding ferritin-like protein
MEKKKVITYLNELEGFKTASKNFHFSAKNLNEHEVIDSITSMLSEYQDEIAEIYQGINGQFLKNTIKGMNYQLKTSKLFIKDILKSTNRFYESIDSNEYVGIKSVLEEFIGKLNKQSYLLDLSLKEDFKRNYKNKINESRNKQSRLVEYSITSKELNQIIGEAIQRVFKRTF